MKATTSSSQAAIADSPAPIPPARLWIPLALLTLFALQSLWFIGTQSLTYDEPGHIAAGLEAWQHGRFQQWTDHPPLGRFWLTLPIAFAPVEIAQEQLQRGYRVTAMQPGPEWLAWHTRPMNTLLGIALGLTLWLTARRLFSEGAANVALALFAFTPSLIAHFSVATTDGIGALFVFLAAYRFVLWRREPGPRQTVIMGLVLGALLLAKLYTPPEVLLALVLMLVVRRDCGQRGRLNWRPALAALAIALFTFWAGYLFHVSHLKVGDGQVVATFPNRATKTWATKSAMNLTLLVPAGEYVEGFREVAIGNRRGRPTWFLGQVYPKRGTKLYYPVAIALKWPTMLLMLFFASLALGVRRSCRSPGDLLMMCLFGLVFLTFALQSHFDIGERHILPLYPFALLIAGGIWQHARKHRAAVLVVVLALCLNAADTLRCAPDYLAYFNIFVKPQNSWRLLTDSNLDWGQGLIALRDYQRQHPGEALHLAYFGSVDPSLYGIRALPLAPGETVQGTIVAGATCLSGQVLDDPAGYRWLWERKPQQLIDHVLWVFDAQ
ncbi:MAG TPA: glycosyltransferase family 39 protein [Terriglobales bacterium]|nr:glycosyltransferase family 39 protein [Terriglobales bacterium]